MQDLVIKRQEITDETGNIVNINYSLFVKMTDGELTELVSYSDLDFILTVLPMLHNEQIQASKDSSH